MALATRDSATHLHNDDCPATLVILRELANGREVPGIEATEYGMHVDWTELLASFLSTTEKASVHIARGVAVVEQHGGGGLPVRYRTPVRYAIQEVTR